MSDLPAEMARFYGISLVPGILYIDGVKYQSDLDLFTDELDSVLKTDSKTLKTGAPPPAAYYSAYEKLYNDVDAIISLHCPAKQSGMINSAKVAAKRFSDPSKIFHFECGVATLGLGLSTLATAMLAQHTNNLSDLLEHVQVYCKKIQIIGVLDTFKYVRRSGRIKLLTKLANVLHIKPVLIMRDSGIYLVERPRKRQLALELMLDILVNTLDYDIQPQMIGLSHYLCEEECNDFEQKIRKKLPDFQIIRGNPDPMIIANTGPGLLLLAHFSSSNIAVKGGRKISI